MGSQNNGASGCELADAGTPRPIGVDIDVDGAQFLAPLAVYDARLTNDVSEQLFGSIRLAATKFQ